MTASDIPPAFVEMSRAFDRSVTYLFEGDEFANIRGHPGFVEPEHRAQARACLVELLAGPATGDVLEAIWRAGASEIRIESGIRCVFEILRDEV